MPRYKLSPEERAAEKERKENLRNIMKGLNVKNFDDLKDVFKMMVGEMLENGLDGELDDELGYTLANEFKVIAEILNFALQGMSYVSFRLLEQPHKRATTQGCPYGEMPQIHRL